MLRFWQSRVLPADGRVFGKMGHSERSGNGLYKNVPGTLYQPIFEGGVNTSRNRVGGTSCFV